MRQPEIGIQGEKSAIVTKELLAKNVGSGDVAVYATPMMLALMEGAAAELLLPFLEEGETSVGSSLCSSHLAPTPEGMKVRAVVAVTAVEGRKVVFSVKAYDERGLIGEGSHERVALNRERFEAKARG